ncbi:MAG: carboxypeptidase-like regulatory domain-containing protein, partial [Pyrinomonadaceae bacterium]
SHVVAWVNSQYAVFNKTGTLLLGPINGNTLFAGVGNNCESTNRGDPILQYDRLADRWILSQFAFSAGANATPPYFQCIAVSTSGNPLGTYVRYSVAFSNTSPSGFNDYGKLGVWPDGYYTAYNMFNSGTTFTGAGLCVSDRVKMLAGDPAATTLCAPFASYAGGGSFLPADLEGTTLPTNSSQGGIFIRQSTAPALRLLKLKADFTASTVTLTDGLGGAAGSFVNIPITLTRACNGTGGTCVAQPGTTNLLDTLGDRMMYRLAYRNISGVDRLVVSMSEDVDGAGARSAAIRWFEIRNPFGAAPTLFQNATYDPGASGDRWMSSMATNRCGDIGLSYNVVNAGTSLKPSIGVTGRLSSDAVNTMQAETVTTTGTGSQTGGLTRWGDYSTMQIDPSDDVTFWYISQYLAADGSFNWRTRIASAKFTTCAPTAAGVTVSGRVISGAAGRGLTGAVVRLTDQNGGVRNAVTSRLGTFSFGDVEPGQTYVISVVSRRFNFAPRVIQVVDNVTDLELMPE